MNNFKLLIEDNTYPKTITINFTQVDGKRFLMVIKQ